MLANASLESRALLSTTTHHFGVVHRQTPTMHFRHIAHPMRNHVGDRALRALADATNQAPTNLVPATYHAIGGPGAISYPSLTGVGRFSRGPRAFGPSPIGGLTGVSSPNSRLTAMPTNFKIAGPDANSSTATPTPSGPGGMMAIMPASGGAVSPEMTSDPVALAKFQKDSQAILDKSQVTPAMLATLRNDIDTISAAAKSAPNLDKVKAFEANLVSLAETFPTSAQLSSLQNDFEAVVSSEGVTDPMLVPKVFTDLNTVIVASQITAEDINMLKSDIKDLKVDYSMPLPLGSGFGFDVLHVAIKPSEMTSGDPVPLPGPMFM
jgi:hypothetical protein